MSDTLYLSLWYPNLRLAAMPDKLAAVLGAFAAHGGEARVYASTVWPINWTETPIFQRVFGHGERGAEPRQAVEDALELLHEDYAYEFQVGWSLWELETGEGGDPTLDTEKRVKDGAPMIVTGAGRANAKATAGPSTPLRSAQDDRLKMTAQGDKLKIVTRDDKLIGRWVREPRLVRVTGFGPLFDEGAYEQDGHIRIDFGTDTPFLEEDAELEQVGAKHVEENVRQLIELTAAVEKDSGATARLLWSELGESLAQRLAARLGVTN
jgi:antitoxin (DNA-binding transcriptional repressor) of toxin-antitoxin stability system